MAAGILNTEFTGHSHFAIGMSIRRRTVSFSIFDSVMTRTVLFEDGRQYAHRCDLESFQSIAHRISEGGSHTMFSLHEQSEIPYTRINITLEFLKERGCVWVVGRKTYAASNFTYEDAMLEWSAFAHQQ